MPDKRVVFSKHSLEQIQRRGLTKEWVIDMIRDPHIALPRRSDNTQELRKKRHDVYCFAVVKHKKSSILVITAGETGRP